MKRAMWVLVISSLAFLGAAPQANAMSLSVGPEFDLSLPLSDWADGAGLGIGGMGRVEFFPIDMVGVGFRAGYIYHLDKNNVGYSEIPFILSGKYVTPFGLYAELGLGMFVNKVDMGDLGSDSETKLGFILGAGFKFSSVYLAANFYSPNLSKVGDGIMGLMFTVGYAYSIGF